MLPLRALIMIPRKNIWRTSCGILSSQQLVNHMISWILIQCSNSKKSFVKSISQYQGIIIVFMEKRSTRRNGSNTTSSNKLELEPIYQMVIVLKHPSFAIERTDIHPNRASTRFTISFIEQARQVHLLVNKWSNTLFLALNNQA